MQNEQNFALATLQKRTSMANVAAGLLSHRNSCPRKKSRRMSRRSMTNVAVGLCPTAMLTGGAPSRHPTCKR